MSEIPLDCWDWFDMDKTILMAIDMVIGMLEENEWSDFDEFEYGYRIFSFWDSMIMIFNLII